MELKIYQGEIIYLETYFLFQSYLETFFLLHFHRQNIYSTFIDFGSQSQAGDVKEVVLPRNGSKATKNYSKTKAKKIKRILVQYDCLFRLYLGFLLQTLTIHRTAVKGRGYFLKSSLPLRLASQTLRPQPGNCM